MDSVNGTCGLHMWVSPFRYLRINVYLPLPAAFRSLSRLSSALSAKASTLRSYCLIIAILLILLSTIRLILWQTCLNYSRMSWSYHLLIIHLFNMQFSRYKVYSAPFLNHNQNTLNACIHKYDDFDFSEGIQCLHVTPELCFGVERYINLLTCLHVMSNAVANASYAWHFSLSIRNFVSALKGTFTLVSAPLHNAVANASYSTLHTFFPELCFGVERCAGLKWTRTTDLTLIRRAL